MKATYRCVNCESEFEHPNVEECETIGSNCALLVCAGWSPVWVRVLVDVNSDRERHIFSKGGWICPQCVARFAPAPERPAHKRRVRRRNHRNSDRELS